MDAPTTTSDCYGNCPYLADFYNTVLIPYGYFNSLFIPINQPETRTRLGVLMVHRSRGEANFTQQEREYLLHVAEIIAYGLSQPALDSISTMDGWEQGLLIVDKNRQLQFSCSTGKKLLALATDSIPNNRSNGEVRDLSIISGLEPLIERILISDKHKSINLDSTIKITNTWGEFILRGFLINDSSDNSPKISFNISLQEPFVLKLFSRIKILNLTPRQETIALLYAAGDQHKIIADKLDISLHTVKEHVKNICDRLGICSRSDLISHILCKNTEVTTQ